VFLPAPPLDDARWSDLVEESRALVPFYAPAWTDHNASDPGITFVELLAWIAEMQIFQLDQVPARHRRAFLALAGVQQRPPRPARTLLRFELPTGAAPVWLPRGLECAGAGAAGDIGFRTRHALHVVHGRVAGLAAVEATGETDLTARWERGEPIPPFGTAPRPGAALVLALTAAPPEGVHVTVAIATAHGREDAAPSGHHDAEVAWEALSETGRWRRVEMLADGTRALTRDGIVRFVISDPLLEHATPAGPRWLLRVRHAHGAYDDVPWLREIALNGAEAEQSVALRDRWAIAEHATVIGEPAPGERQHLGIEIDARGAIVRLDVTDEAAPPVTVLSYTPTAPGAPGELVVAARQLGRSSGDPEQRFELAPAPVDAGSLRLYAGHGGTWRQFDVRRDLGASGPADAHVTFDASRGQITFGDGHHGVVVPPGDLVVVVCRTTLAENGNVPAGTVDRLEDGAPAGLSVTQPQAAAGGAAAETLGEAEVRAAALVEAPTRAVTLADVEQLARATPGTRIARVVALGNRHPAFACVMAAGIDTVVIVPHLPADRPEPSDGLLRAVAAHLAARRLVGTRIEATGPQYVTVAIRATVAAHRLAVVADVRDRIVATLDAFLHPLHGGPAGTGWPFGRDVMRTELLQVIDNVAGVDHVLALELVGAGGASCGNLCLGPLDLVDAGEHAITVVGG
jgi:predicted phage baseplate assembly protein